MTEEQRRHIFDSLDRIEQGVGAIHRYVIIEQTREQQPVAVTPPERKVPQPFAELIFVGVDRDSTFRLAEHGYGIYRIADVEACCK